MRALLVVVAARARPIPSGLAGVCSRSATPQLLVTLVILSVGLTTLLQNFVRALTFLERERIITTAVFLADYLVEEFQNESPMQDSDEIVRYLVGGATDVG